MTEQEIDTKIRVLASLVSRFHEFVDERETELAEAKSRLAEAEKPELRHGDIRLWFNSTDDAVGIVDLSEKTPCIIWDGDDLRNAKTENTILSQSKSIGNIKKVFGDLKALSEPLKEFTIDGVQCYIKDECLELYDVDAARNPVMAIIDKTNISEFILNIQRLVFTAGQEAVK